jgi:hypothetical protein
MILRLSYRRLSLSGNVLFKNSLNLKNITNPFDLSIAKISLSVGIIIGHQNKTKLI